MKVTVVDYGMGNLRSVARAFESLNAEVELTGDPARVEAAERIVLPGVGAFGEGMRNLEKAGLVPALEQAVLKRKVPFLGICLGMQLLARESYENGTHKGLGWIPATVRPFDGNDEFRALHIRWNSVHAKPNPLIPANGRIPHFYFVHGYHLDLDPGYVIGATRYGIQFPSAILKENIAGVQFHPEKSQETGLGLLQRFLRWDPKKETSPASNQDLSPAYKPNMRIIPTLLYHKGRLTKTVRFQIQDAGIRRDVGHPVKAPMVYDAQLADELVFLDFRASVEGRGIEELAEAVSNISGKIFMPLAVGGGIRSVRDIQTLLRAGADKVVINTFAVQNPAFIQEAANVFGSQCIVVSIDAKKNGSDYEVFTHSGTKPTGLNPVHWAKKVEELGAGEILLTSIDRDGTMEGYDLVGLAQPICKAVKIPVILSGGAGKLQDIADAVKIGCADSAAVASLFHFTDLSPIKAKAFLGRNGFWVRN